MIELELSDREANVVKQALCYWVSNSRAKAGNIRSSEASALAGQIEMTASLKADIEYVNTTLPVRIDAAENIIKRIGEGARTAAGL